MPLPFRSTLLATWGIRRRSALAAVAVVGCALLLGCVGLLIALQTILVSGVRDQLSGRAADLATLAETQGLAVGTAAVRQDGRRSELVQLLGADHRVLAASDPRLQDVPMVQVQVARGATRTVGLPDLPQVQDSDDYLVAIRGLELDGQRYEIVVARPVQVLTDTVQTVAVLLAVATPLALLLVGGAVWYLVGRPLRSVDRIRAQVEAIGDGRLGSRVDVPTTGDEVARLAVTMNSMLARLQLADQTLRAFVSDASHELRSPLATLATTSEVAALDPTGGQWQKLRPLVLAEVSRMSQVVDGLLTLAKADAHTLIDRSVDVDLDDVVDNEVARFRAVGSHQIRVQLEPARVSGDPGRLAQVVRNLVDNADRYAHHAILLTLQVNSGWVTLTVDNDGPPIPAEQREAVFGRFVRLDESREAGHGGSGLGLAISREIAVAHHGSVTAGVSDQGWCRFAVYLPLAEV